MSRHKKKLGTTDKPSSPSDDESAAHPPKRPTMREVAAEAGVSISAVSIAMRDAEGLGRETRAHILKTASSLGYQRNRAASLMKLTHTGIIGLTLDPANHFHVELARKIHGHAAHLNREVVPTFATSKADEKTAVNFLQGLRCDGLILLGPQFNRSELTELAETCALTLIGSSTQIDGADVIHAADVQGQYEVTSHLISLGHTKIAHIDGADHPLAARRRSGYEQAMTEHGLEREIRIVRGGQSTAAGQEAARKLLRKSQPPTAICAFNDAVALGVYDTIQRTDLRVPADIALAGYDNTPTSSLHFISLTSVDQQPDTLSHIAVDAVVKRMTARITNQTLPPTNVAVQPKFIARNTTATRM